MKIRELQLALTKTAQLMDGTTPQGRSGTISQEPGRRTVEALSKQ